MKNFNISIFLQCAIGFVMTSMFLLPVIGGAPLILFPVVGLWLMLGHQLGKQYSHKGFAFAACNLITAGIAVVCTALPSKGTDSTVYIGNWDEIRTGSPTVASNVVTGMLMTVGKQMWAFEGQKTSAKPKAVGRKDGEYEYVFDHELTLTAFKIDGATFLQLQNMKGGKFFALVKHNFYGTAGETRWKFYGLRNGMFLENMTYDPYDANTGGVSFTLKSDTLTGEPELPLAFFNTNIATTETAVGALIVAGV